MSFTRRTVLGLAMALGTSAAVAQTAPTELVFAVIPAENSDGVIGRFTPFVEYLSREVGVKVTLRVANDYAAVIEGMRTGNIHIAHYGPAAFARALMINSPVEAFARGRNIDGTEGYYAVFYVKKDSPIQTIADAKGKNLCMVDPNSASGNQVPRFAMHKMGLTPETHFGKVVNAGSHENAIIGLAQGTCDVATNWWNNDIRSNLKRMAEKGMVKAEDFRIIFRSDQIMNSPVAYRSDLPEPLKAKIRAAFLEIGTRAPEIFQHISGGTSLPWGPAKNEDYGVIVELNRFVDQLRRQRGS